MATIVAPTTEQLTNLVSPYLTAKPAGLGFAIGYASPQVPNNGSLFYAGSLGDQYGNSLALGDDTAFEIASVSKTFTATLYQYLLLGQSNQTPVVGDFCGPEGSLQIGSQFFDISLADLLNYTSGLPQDNVRDIAPPYLPQPYSSDGMLGFLNMTTLQPYPMGQKYRYSNLAFALMAAIVPQLDTSGNEFEALVYDMLLSGETGLGMPGTLFFDDVNLDVLPLGYSYSSNTTCSPGCPGWPMFPAYHGAGGLVSTPADMMTWLQFNMGLIQNTSLSSLLPTLQSSSTTVKTPWGDDLGPGWFITAANASNAGSIWKDGELAGFNSYIAFVPSTNPGTTASEAGVFVLTNSSGLTDSGAEVVAAIANDVLLIMQAQEPLADKSVYPRTIGRWRDG